MLAILLLALFSLILALIASVSLRNGFFVFLILYGVYPRFLAVGIGEGGFAITGPRVFILILALTFLGRFILNDKLVTRGLNKCRTEWLLLTMLGILVVAKVCGSIIWGRFDVGSLGAFGSDVLWYPFGVVLALTVLRKEQDFFLVFVCLGFSILLNSIAVALEVIRDQSIFSGNIEVQYETFSDFNVLEGKTRDGSYRAMGTTPNPLVLARMVCFALPGLLVLLLSRVNFEFRIIGLLGLVASLPIVLLTQA